MKRTVFREEQRFRGWDVYLWLGFFLSALTYRAIAGLAGWWGAPTTAPVASYLLFALIVGAIFLYFFSIRLITKIDERGIRFQFYPLHIRKHRIDWDEIAACHIVNEPARSALTGWCVDFTDERRFSVTGRRTGLALELKDGRHLFIGTKHPADLQRAIREMKPELL